MGDREERGGGEGGAAMLYSKQGPNRRRVGNKFFLPPHLFHRDREQSANYLLLLGKCG